MSTPTADKTHKKQQPFKHYTKIKRFFLYLNDSHIYSMVTIWNGIFPHLIANERTNLSIRFRVSHSVSVCFPFVETFANALYIYTHIYFVVIPFSFCLCSCFRFKNTTATFLPPFSRPTKKQQQTYFHSYKCNYEHSTPKTFERNDTKNESVFESVSQRNI